MRRLLAPLLLALIALLLVPSAASADVVEAPADVVETPADVVLAAAADDEPLGPDPIPRDELDNPARSLAGYEDPDLPFHWAASLILLVVGVVGLVIGIGLWYLLVVRPAKHDAA
ncbi:MAG: hypothetical protein WEB03_13015 [Nitriliruptor sp.]|uniref:hypothetical protein n=1 Tax=Nitriliruptor sp. TaxID=2448056 RepID=UPI0034A006C9